MEWQKHLLEDLTEPVRPITYGVVKPGDHDDQNGVVFVRGGDIADGRIDIPNLRTITQEVSQKYKRTLLRGGEILVSLVGNPGAVATVPSELAGANIARQAGLIALKDGVDRKFVEYFLRSPAGQAAMGLFIKGAVQKVINLGDLKRVEIPLPPLPIQRRIAGILSTYDDLIEVNTRRIKALEEMARRTYEEWFVHYRFPGGDGTRPDGWAIGTLDDVVILQRGFDLPRRDRMEGPHPIISASGVSGSHVEYKVKAPGLVTGRSGTLGEVMLAWDDFWPLNTTLWAKSLPTGSLFFAYYTLLQIDLVGFNTGAAVPTLNRNDIRGLVVEIPDRDTLDRFEQIANSYHLFAKRLSDQNTNLRAQRDLLLPQLVSGAIDVSDAEVILPEPAEVAAE